VDESGTYDVQPAAATSQNQQPPREHVQARERHVPRADHQGHEEVPEPGRDRHDDHEDHRRAVEREQLVVGGRVEERVVRRAELDPHQQRLEAAHQEEERGREQVEDPDLLVVGGRDPVDPAGAPLG
jgi:hypothetical protein